ncbi:hypothetical protein KJA16_01695 [Patescibacteria group bacterium]|nr:hypothetical protein [Patescibacteria group bacterium]
MEVKNTTELKELLIKIVKANGDIKEGGELSELGVCKVAALMGLTCKGVSFEETGVMEKVLAAITKEKVHEIEKPYWE